MHLLNHLFWCYSVKKSIMRICWGCWVMNQIGVNKHLHYYSVTLLKKKFYEHQSATVWFCYLFSHPSSKKILLLLLLQRALKVWSADFPPPLQEKEAHRHGGSIGFNQNRANPPRVARIRLPVSVSACGRQVRGRWVIKLTHSWCWHDRLSLARRSLMQGWMQWKQSQGGVTVLAPLFPIQPN